MKRGISNIIAVVLIVLISIAAITIFWFVVIPMFNLGNLNHPEIMIDTFGGNTFYYPNEGIACVHLSRGTDGLKIDALKFIFMFEDEKSEENIQNDVLPENSAKRYCFDMKEWREEHSELKKVKISYILEGDEKELTSKNIVESKPNKMPEKIISPDNIVVYLIDSCQKISSPGKYRLIKDINVADSNSCFEINSSNVWLDCNGHYIKSETNIKAGVHVEANKVNVSECEISMNRDYGKGIVLENSQESVIKDNILNLNNYGIYLKGGSENKIINNIVNQNTYGILAVYSSKNEISGNSVCGNTEYDFYCETSETSPLISGVNNKFTKVFRCNKDAWPSSLGECTLLTNCGDEECGSDERCLICSLDCACVKIESPTLPGDLNFDCRVDVKDLVFVRNNFVVKVCDESNNWCNGADVNHDKSVNLLDLIVMRDRLDSHDDLTKYPSNTNCPVKEWLI